MPSLVRPIKPSEVVAAKTAVLPDEVLEAFNELIVKKWDGRSATVKQDDVVTLAVEKLEKRTEKRENWREYAFEQGWFDVEDIYRAQGWDVEYDKPAYCESYPAKFIFKRRSAKS